MDASTWIAALLLGLAGGVHCAGMCGGIVAALSAAGRGSARPLAFTAAYHAGRAASYTVAGAIAGTLGEAGLALRGTLGVHQLLFAVASSALLAAGLYVAGYAPFVRRLEAAGSVLWRRIEPFSRPLLPARTPLQAGLLGTIWGWLPCGMVYGALLIALASGSAPSGAITMAAFALGTMPSLLAVGVAARAVRRPTRRGFRILAGAAIAALGVYGLVRLAAHFAAFAQICETGAFLH